MGHTWENISKIRYGLQLIGKVRWTSEDPEQGDLKDIQKVQNKMLRLINGSRLIDKISTMSLLAKANMLSVNQINAQVKILEVWKAMHDPNHPLKIEKIVHEPNSCRTRAVTNGNCSELVEYTRS